MDKNKEKKEIENPETELSLEELEEASGGIIIYGKTKPSIVNNPNIRFAELNPQPLPPGPPPDKFKIKSLGGPDT